VKIAPFAEQHVAALEADEARHNLILAMLGSAASDAGRNLRFWSLGSPGACAVQSPGWPIVLGELDEGQCHRLADALREVEFRGVVGPGMSARWFADRAEEIGLRFAERIPQRILKIEGPPRYPGAPGSWRCSMPGDAALLAEWGLAFWQEATPHDSPPAREQLERGAAEGGRFVWVVDGRPVSMAAIARRTRHGLVINSVYTPPALRSRGYAGSITAALVEEASAQGCSFTCLYVDARNAASNRCYAKIGFTPICDSWHCVRVRRGAA
jgi:RimJ/RimL family protein N-acetyltransferase